MGGLRRRRADVRDSKQRLRKLVEELPEVVVEQAEDALRELVDEGVVLQRIVDALKEGR